MNEFFKNTISTIEMIEEKIIKYKLVEIVQYEKKIKYLLFLLNEAKSDCKNNKYFSIKNAVSCMEELLNIPEITEIKSYVFLLSSEIEFYFEEMINYELDIFTDNYKKILMEELEKYPEIKTEFINYLLNDKDLNKIDESDETISVNGYTIKQLIDEYNCNYIEAIDALIRIKENPTLNPEIILDDFLDLPF